jgi:adenylate kinase
MIVVLLGAPGAGKGTQAVDLAAALTVPHVSTGDLFRAHLRERTPLGIEAETYMSRGDLVPDATVIAMVRDRLAESDAAAGAVLDGFPRTVGQAEALDRLVSTAGDLPRAVALDVSRAALVARLTGRRVCRAQGHPYHIEYRPPRVEGVCDVDGSALYQRTDDTLETVRNRLDVYDRETAPLLGYYRSSGRLDLVDGDDAPGAVAARLAGLFGL